MHAAEKMMVAYHELAMRWWAGSWNPQTPCSKVSSSPGGKGLGYAQCLPREQYLYIGEQLFDVCTMLGGCMAEQLFFGRVTMGAQGRPEEGHPEHLCRDRAVRDERGRPRCPSISTAKRRGAGGEAVQRGHGPAHGREVRRLIGSAHARTLDLLTRCREQVDKVGRQLLERKVLGRPTWWS